VLLDAELAALYGVATKVLLQAVKRNMERFPEDFMIQVTVEEWAVLWSHNVTSNPQRSGRRYLPYAFTEQGVAMLASVLNSPRAIAANILIMRVRAIAAMLSSNKELARKFAQLRVPTQHKACRARRRYRRHPLRHATTHESTNNKAPRHRLHRQAIARLSTVAQSLADCFGDAVAEARKHRPPYFIDTVFLDKDSGSSSRTFRLTPA
jgi:hypothetical protein